ncbi:long-chain-fatty-acid-ligase [Raphidocelis subcapitata]|uniref:Long-chain-fatty-acid-ligase n=1 Tax=Raphidocelis subcapitata TaxID=307507 RepID=A0A2V0NST6_9CHLO|nr:long-chain-fatty-acid-ligase [Raphidocelis subcapitata]|eukprot:GBF88603.1 long-chain-fatty-acid-ligase [Raphidocelis subcapitata]
MQLAKGPVSRPAGQRGRSSLPGNRPSRLGPCRVVSQPKQAFVLGGGAHEGGALPTAEGRRAGAALPAPAASDTPFEPLTAIWAHNAERHGALTALRDPHHPGAPTYTYAQLHSAILDCGAALRGLGLEPGERVCLFAENSARWLIADQGVIAAGAADAVRGSSAPDAELSFILGHSRPRGLIVQDEATLARLAPVLASDAAPRLRFVAVLWPHQGQQLPRQLPGQGCPVLGFEELLARGSGARAAGDGAPFQPHAAGRDDVATLVYTSGTTGHPKGVMLTHGNLRSQIDNFPFFLEVQPGDSALSLLPPWHVYERTAALYIASRGATTTYTSKLRFREDLTAVGPDHFVCVPLVLEMLHAKVMAKLRSEKGVKGAIVKALLAASLAYVAANRVALGTALAYARAAPPLGVAVWASLLAALLRPIHRIADALVFAKVRAALGIRKTIVSGGGSLPRHIDDFFEAAGLTVVVGYGLTETAPVLACRRASPPTANIRGTVGLPIPGTRLRVVDPDSLRDLPDGEQGLIVARGPGVTPGYFDDASSTAAAFIDGGWFVTGDLGWRAPAGVGGAAAGHLVLTGRAKDTIVLVSGKNVEPAPIEDALCTSPYIKHAVVLGQDRRELGALLFTDEEALEADGVVARRDPNAKTDPSEAARVEALVASEAARALAEARPDARPEERVARFAVVRAPLSPDDGTLTRTLKPRRAAVLEREADAVARLTAQLRG